MCACVEVCVHEEQLIPESLRLRRQLERKSGETLIRCACVCGGMRVWRCEQLCGGLSSCFQKSENAERAGEDEWGNTPQVCVRVWRCACVEVCVYYTQLVHERLCLCRDQEKSEQTLVCVVVCVLSCVEVCVCVQSPPEHTGCLRQLFSPFHCFPSPKQILELPHDASPRSGRSGC